MKIPEDLLYTKEHEWARIENGIAVVGVTDYAQEQLGDIVYVELPEVGREIKQMESFGVIESVKAVSELFSPLSGTIEEVNEELSEHPEYINQDPYGKGWIIKVKVKDEKEKENLLNAEEYKTFVEEERK